MLIFMFGCLIALLIGLYGIYVGLITKKNKVLEAFSGIDVQLKKRYDLMPNIIALAKGYMAHEKQIFERITELRTQALAVPKELENAGTKFKLDAEIKGLMKDLLVSVENYPELKANQTMIKAMNTYTDVEDHIAAARRFYNSAVNELNNAVEIFPSSVVASWLGIKKQEFFQAEGYERQAINL